MIPLIVIVVVLVLFAVAVRIAKGSEASNRVGALERELERLGGRVAMLESRGPVEVEDVPVRTERVVASEVLRPVARVPVVARAAAPPVPVRVSVEAPPVVEPEVVVEPKRSVSLEERLGQNWLNKLGIVILVTGLVLLLGYKLRTLGPLGKSGLGLVLSGAILVAGLVMERKDRYRMFARAAIGGGWALLYFVTFGLFHVPAMQVLHSQGVDLVLMLGVAAGMVLHSLRYRSQVVTSLAFLLGFFTVSISHVTVFSLVASAILATGLVLVAFRQRWFVLTLGGLIAVYANHFLWLQRVLPEGGQAGHAFAEFLPSAGLLLFYWLLFRVFYIFRVPEKGRDRVCSTANVLLNSTGLLALLKYQSTHPEWAFGGLLVLGAAEVVLAFVARRRHRDGFVMLSCIGSLLLLAAIPFRFAGASWSLSWLLESELLFVAGLTLRETVFRRLGVVSAFAATAHLLIVGALPVFDLRQSGPDAGHHAVLCVAFVCAALAAWFNAEFASRRWPQIVEAELDRGGLRGLSYVAMLCAGVAAWLAFGGAWTLLPWLLLAWVLSLVADRVGSADLAQQAEVLGAAALARAALVNFMQWDQFGHVTRVAVPLAAGALLYAQMRRKQMGHVLPQRAIAPAYTWAAAGLLATLAAFALPLAWVAVAWGAFGVVLLEVGLGTRKSFFLQQGLALLAASFAGALVNNLALASAPRLYTMLPLAALFAWAYQRVHAAEETSRMERLAGAACAWFALGTVAMLLYFGLRPAWVSIGGAVLAVAALGLAWVLRRSLFRAQGVVLIAATAARALAFNVLSPAAASGPFVESMLFTVGVTCALLLAALPIAYSLRGQELPESVGELPWLTAILRRPEQVLFFATLAVLFGLVPVELRAGMITVGWAALGLLTFLFALTVGERSFRLTGLGLLLLGVGKILTVDVWQAPPIDRYVTLIVMGAALLLVSFLYSRYRETILKLL